MQNILREFRGRVAIGNADLIYNRNFVDFWPWPLLVVNYEGVDELAVVFRRTIVFLNQFCSFSGDSQLQCTS